MRALDFIMLTWRPAGFSLRLTLLYITAVLVQLAPVSEVRSLFDRSGSFA
jgi:hypothetical protein